jgi:uncharacterized RDD family membrane protein YckC
MADVVNSGFQAGKPAAKGKRFAAGVIDLVLVPILLGLVIGLLLVAAPDMIRSVILVVANIAWLVIRDAVYAPGRQMVGLKLVSLTGAKVTVGQAILRNVLLIVPFVLVIGYIVEIVAVLSKGSRVADGWAKTQVIEK